MQEITNNIRKKTTYNFGKQYQGRKSVGLGSGLLGYKEQNSEEGDEPLNLEIERERSDGELGIYLK